MAPQRVRFIGLSADCWTSRVRKGFVGIEIRFVYLNLDTGEFIPITMCLGCIDLPKTLAPRLWTVIAPHRKDRDPAECC